MAKLSHLSGRSSELSSLCSWWNLDPGSSSEEKMEGVEQRGSRSCSQVSERSVVSETLHQNRCDVLLVDMEPSHHQGPEKWKCPVSQALQVFSSCLLSSYYDIKETPGFDSLSVLASSYISSAFLKFSVCFLICKLGIIIVLSHRDSGRIK